MKHIYKKARKIKYNNHLFQIVIRDDLKIGFFKIIIYENKEEFVYPTVQEFLHLNSIINVKNGIKF